MAVNINSNIPPRQNVASVFNPKTGVDALAPERKQLEAPGTAVPKTARSEQVKADPATILTLDEERNKAANAPGNIDSIEGSKLDAPDRNAQKALTAYRDVGLADKRSEIQALVGVDLFV